jgi:hypothetical protein
MPKTDRLHPERRVEILERRALTADPRCRAGVASDLAVSEAAPEGLTGGWRVIIERALAVALGPD